MPPECKNPDLENRRTIKVSAATHSLVLARRLEPNASMDEYIQLAIRSFEDRSAAGYLAEGSYMLREIDVLVQRVEQLVLSNYSVVEALVGIEGAALQSLIQSAQIAEDLLGKNGESAS